MEFMIMLLCSWLSITAVDKVMGACVLEVSEEAIMIYDLDFCVFVVCGCEVMGSVESTGY